MISRADITDKDWIIQSLSCEEGLNTPVISQIERHGFGKTFQEIWLYGEPDASKKCILMRHFNHLYLHFLEMSADYEEIASFSYFLGAEIIWAKLSILTRLAPFLMGFMIEPSKHMVLLDSSRLLETEEPFLAAMDDASELAQMVFKEKDNKRFYFSESEIKMGIRRRMEMNECRYMIIKEDDIIVAQAYTTIETENFITIGGVVTKEGYRGKGLGGKVVSALCHLIIKQGKKPNLFYHNEAAGSVYKRLGFSEAGDYGLMIKETL